MADVGNQDTERPSLYGWLGEHWQATIPILAVFLTLSRVFIVAQGDWGTALAILSYADTTKLVLGTLLWYGCVLVLCMLVILHDVGVVSNTQLAGGTLLSLVVATPVDLWVAGALFGALAWSRRDPAGAPPRVVVFGYLIVWVAMVMMTNVMWLPKQAIAIEERSDANGSDEGEILEVYGYLLHVDGDAELIAVLRSNRTVKVYSGVVVDLEICAGQTVPEGTGIWDHAKRVAQRPIFAYLREDVLGKDGPSDDYPSCEGR